MLVRPVRVGAAGDDDVQAVGLVVGSASSSPAALAAAYGLRGASGSVLVAKPVSTVAVDLVGRDLEEARRPGARRVARATREDRLEQDVDAR